MYMFACDVCMRCVWCMHVICICVHAMCVCMHAMYVSMFACDMCMHACGMHMYACDMCMHACNTYMCVCDVHMCAIEANPSQTNPSQANPSKTNRIQTRIQTLITTHKYSQRANTIHSSTQTNTYILFEKTHRNCRLWFVQRVAFCVKFAKTSEKVCEICSFATLKQHKIHT